VDGLIISLFPVLTMTRLLLLLTALAFWAAPVSSANAASAEYRALWVDVFHDGLRSPQEVDTMLASARRANLNAVFVQVRKACDAYYDSKVEPKNPAVKSGFDPLAYLLRQARNPALGHRIEVHAWLVTYRAKMPGDELWKSSAHVVQRHPEWLSRTVDGKLEDSFPDNRGRQMLDPGVPEVIDYNLEVVRDILSRYDVDGIHFDYFRYPDSNTPGNVWGYNPVAVERFNKLYGRKGKPAPADPQWGEFRRQQVEFMARKVYAHVRAWRPQVKVSAALIVYGSPSDSFERTDPYKQVFQDWPRIAAGGWLDILMPMNYKRESVPAQAKWHRDWARFLGQTAQSTGRFALNGVDGEQLNTLDGILAQSRDTRRMPGITGIAHYCYAETRKGSGAVPDTAFFDALKKNLYPGLAQPPDMPWLTRPREGIVKGIATSNGKRLDGARVRVGQQTVMTDGTGFFAAARISPGPTAVTLLDGDGNATGRVEVMVKAGGVAEATLNVGSGARR